MKGMTGAHKTVLVSLLGIATLYTLGFQGHWLRVSFNALPPLLFAAAIALRVRTATFWASIMALFWFSYGVMEAWAWQGSARLYALGITALSIVVIVAGSWAGLIARFGKKPQD